MANRLPENKKGSGPGKPGFGRILTSEDDPVSRVIDKAMGRGPAPRTGPAMNGRGVSSGRGGGMYSGEGGGDHNYSGKGGGGHEYSGEGGRGAKGAAMPPKRMAGQMAGRGASPQAGQKPAKAEASPSGPKAGAEAGTEKPLENFSGDMKPAQSSEEVLQNAKGLEQGLKGEGDKGEEEADASEDKKGSIENEEKKKEKLKDIIADSVDYAFSRLASTMSDGEKADSPEEGLKMMKKALGNLDETETENSDIDKLTEFLDSLSGFSSSDQSSE